MDRTLIKKKSPRFDRINKYNVAIVSLRNKLKHAVGIDELTTIASRIIDLENQILVEKSIGYKELEDKKRKIETRINRLQRRIQMATSELDQVDNTLDFRLNGYKKTLQIKIDLLNKEYNEILRAL